MPVEGTSIPAPPTAAAQTTPPITPSTSALWRYGVGFLLFGLLWAVANAMVISVLLPQRLSDLDGAGATALLGTVSAFGAVSSLASNILFGNFSDRTRSRLGRRTPWMLAGAVLGGAALATVGMMPTGALAGAAYCVAMIGLNMMMAPAVAVIFDRIPFAARGTMSAAFGGGTTAGFPLGAIAGAAFIDSPLQGCLLAGAAMTLSGLLCVALWPREGSSRRLVVAGAGSLAGLIASFRPPRHAPDFYKAFVGRLLMLVSYQMIMGYQLFIIQDYLGQSTAQSAATISTASVITLVVALISSFVGGPLSDRLRRRKVPVVIASIMFAVGVAMPWILPSTLGFFLFAAIAGFGFGMYSAVDQALNVDVLPSEEHAGKDLGILNLATTAGQAMGPMITSAIVVATGSYAVAFPVSIVAAVLGATIILWIRSVD